MNKRHWFVLLAVMAALVVVAACGKNNDVSCPHSGTAVSGVSPYSISVGTTYESGNLGAFETFTFTAPNSGNYSGCVGTTAKTDMAFILKDGFGVAIAPPCDDYWEDHPDEKCSTADAGISLTGGLTYSIYAENWGPVYGGATYTVTVTKD